MFEENQRTPASYLKIVRSTVRKMAILETAVGRHYTFNVERSNVHKPTFVPQYRVKKVSAWRVRYCQLAFPRFSTPE